AMNRPSVGQRKAMYHIIRGLLDKRAGVSLGMSEEAIDDMCRREMAIRLVESDEQAKKELDALLTPEEPEPNSLDFRPPRLSGAARGQRYHRYFSGLISKLKKRGFRSRNAPRRHYYSIGAGHGFRSDIEYSCSFNHGGKARVELYIGSDTTYNKTLFDWLYSHREAIQNRFGGPLDWQRLDDNKASRVAVFPINGSIDDDDESLNAVQNWMAEHIAKLDRALGPTLDQFTV
ncbi:MAG: DUF4268 domain-containing protein, partial [Chloroflexota bacterium]|nr:DUF4268 domain-containing protein [Chloroflexota bacterium]